MRTNDYIMVAIGVLTAILIGLLVNVIHEEFSNNRFYKGIVLIGSSLSFFWLASIAHKIIKK